MAGTVGFKRATFFEYDKDGATVSRIVVEGKQNQGGTVEASISGLSAEAVKVYASDIAYYVAQRGTGSVELSLSILDMPDNLIQSVLGRKPSEDGIVRIGSNTEPPYVGVLLESHSFSGEPVFFGLLKGKFRLDEKTLQTNEDTLAEPEPDSLEGSFIANEDGDTVITATGEDKRSAVEALFGTVRAGTTTSTTTKAV